MNGIKFHGGWVIFLSLFGAFWLQALPLPAGLDLFRPQWPLLVLFYWTLALPHRPVLLYAWLTGIFQDALQSSIFGLHALSYVLIGFLILRLYQRLRFLSLLYQSGVVFVCVLFHLFILLWSYRLNDYSVNSLMYWLAALTSSIAWPMVYLLLRTVQNRVNVV